MISEKIIMIKRIAAASFLYQEGIMNRQLLANEFKALEGFLTGYAYERNVSVKYYSELARLTLQKIFNHKIEKISSDNAVQAWKTYCDLASNKFPKLRLNCSHNPMNANKGILQRMAEINETHLSNFLTNKIREGKTKEAHEFLLKIRGIRNKIAPFYLRDLIFLSKINESEISDPYLIQPIDIWLERALTQILENEKPELLIDKQKKIVDFCLQAGVSGIDFNQGCWVLGSVVSGDPNIFCDIIKNGSKPLKAIIEEKELFILRLKKYCNKIDHIE